MSKGRRIVLVALAIGVGLVVTASVRRAIRITSPSVLGVAMGATRRGAERAFDPPVRGRFRTASDRALEWEPLVRGPGSIASARLELRDERVRAIRLRFSPPIDPEALARQLDLPPIEPRGGVRVWERAGSLVAMREDGDTVLVEALDTETAAFADEIVRYRNSHVR